MAEPVEGGWLGWAHEKKDRLRWGEPGKEKLRKKKKDQNGPSGFGRIRDS
jgi:hypothetical protein